MNESSPSESLSKLALNTPTNNRSCSLDIASEEEMASTEAALAATPSSLSSCAAPSIALPSHKTKRTLPSWAGSDIEDFGSLRSTEEKSGVADSLFHRFRSKTGLYVTDVTAADWCEKQKEFDLLSRDRETSRAMATGGARHAILEGEEWCEKQGEFVLYAKRKTTRKTTKAMKAGSARHKKLEEEVVEKVQVLFNTEEDRWALKFLNFIIGANQLMVDGLTRELPLIGFAESVWMVGAIDEIRMPATETDRNAILVDTKTRARDNLPAEAQRRNGRLQLMCYKYMWDNLVADNFPSKQFFDFFSLNPHSALSEEIREQTAESGFPAETLDDIVRLYRNTCSMLPPSHDQLLLRYEFQKDNSLLGEDQFAFEPDWVKNQIQGCLEFWLGEREARYTPEEERWKCKCCRFASNCPANSEPNMTPNPTNTNEK